MKLAEYARCPDARPPTPNRDAIGVRNGAECSSPLGLHLMGVFPVDDLRTGDFAILYGLRWLGRSEGINEEIIAIQLWCHMWRGQHHQLAMQVLSAAPN